jgi:hypothetical protein
MLGQWPAITKKFVKVMPKDYKRVLLEQMQATRPVKAAARGGNGKNGKSVRNGKNGAKVAKGRAGNGAAVKGKAARG